MMRALFFLLGVVLAWPAVAANYYVRPECTNNGNGTAETCAAGGGGVGAYNVMSSITSTADGQVELARGNTVWLIGTSTAAWNPAGVAAGDGASNFLLRGDHALGAGRFDGQNAIATLMALSGSGRNNIEIRGIEFTGATGSCITTGTNTNLVFDDIVIPDAGCGTNGIAINGGGTGIEVRGSSFGAFGPSNNSTGGAIYIQPANGTAVADVRIHGNTFVGDKGVGRYGVSAYPPGTGTVAGLRVFENAFRGSYAYMPINVQNDVDGSHIVDNDIAVTAAQGGVHVGGQGTIGACSVTTDDTQIYDNSIVGTGASSQGSGDDTGNAIYPDECSVRTQARRNRLYGNGVAGIYLNDSADGVFESNVIWANGSNGVNVHGVSDGNQFMHNSISGLGATFGVGAAQGRDVVQFDATAGNTTPNVLRNNVIVGDSGKCVDVDGSGAYLTESHNAVFGCPTLVEGFTQTNGTNADPRFVGGANPTTAEGFKPFATSPLCGAGYPSPAKYDYEGIRFGNPPNIGAYGTCTAGRSSYSIRSTYVPR